MNQITSGHICPLCGYRVPAHTTTGTSVEYVPVIRCKDCKYYNPQQHYCEGIGNWFGYVGEWSDNGYCYKAERKEE